MTNVALPNGWRPRPYQLGLWRYLAGGGKRAVAVCHRRWGKDDLALHWTAVAAHERVGSYWHMLPEYAQARKAIWDAVNVHTGKRRIDEAFPIELRKRFNDKEMFIEFENGSTWQLVGSDSYNQLVGAGPAGVVFSEWSLADPAAWAYFRPMMLESKGWALFIYTSRGKNHGHNTWKLSQAEDGWYGIRQTVNDTGMFSAKDLESELREYISDYGEEDGEALYEQEYFCSFEAAVIGSYYGRKIAELEKAGRITSVPYDPTLPVYTAWDLGIDDSTAIWFVQIVGYEIRVIDYLEVRGRALTDIARDVIAKRYTYIEHYLPHDVDTKEMTSAKTRKETLVSVGLQPIRAGSKLPVQDGINAARNMLSRCVFDASNCEKGLNALRQYRAKWDDKHKTNQKHPLHDWSSHGADAFRELAVQLFDVKGALEQRKQAIAQGDWDPLHFDAAAYQRFSNTGAGDELRMNRQTSAGVDDYNPW